MTTGEIISVIAVCLSFLGVLSSFIFSVRKNDKERKKEIEMNVQNILTIKNDIGNISTNIGEIKKKIDKMEERADTDHEKIIEHDARIKNLEKTVFKKGA